MIKLAPLYFGFLMDDAHKDLLSNLVIISKIDANLARIGADRKKLEAELATITAEIKKIEADHQARSRVLTEKRTRTLKEEKRIAEERDKLVDRRKALSSLGNYKLQQAAGKEIDHSSKELDIHESTVLAMLDEVESHTLALKDVDSLLAQRHEQYTAREAEVAATLSNFEQRQSDYIAERTELAKKIPAPSMAIYEQVRKRFPTDPVVLLNNHSCSGCFMQLGPQAMVQISRGQALLRCRGCGRILHLG